MLLRVEAKALDVPRSFPDGTCDTLGPKLLPPPGANPGPDRLKRGTLLVELSKMRGMEYSLAGLLTPEFAVLARAGAPLLPLLAPLLLLLFPLVYPILLRVSSNRKLIRRFEVLLASECALSLGVLAVLGRGRDALVLRKDTREVFPPLPTYPVPPPLEIAAEAEPKGRGLPALWFCPLELPKESDDFGAAFAASSICARFCPMVALLARNFCVDGNAFP